MTTPIRSQDYALALGPGTRLVQYEIERVLGQGTFGITYLASEPLLGDLGEKVAIKEFLPCDLAGRGANHDTVVPHTPERRDLFRHGLEKFLEEARRLKLLSKGSPPNIVRVRTAFEANGTAYLVMDYYEGMTLTAYIASKSPGGGPSDSRQVDPQDAVTTMVQILRGLAAVHERGFVHRDVKPDNIYLRVRDDGSREALLLDFGAARQALLEQKKTADWTVVLSRGYAPPEQYQRSGEQGPWTDIYACAAVLYQLITGEVPPDGDLRERAAEGMLKGEDMELVSPRKLAPNCPAAVEAAIERGLALDPRERPQTALEFINMLEGGPGTSVEPPRHAATVVLEDTATVVLDHSRTTGPGRAAVQGGSGHGAALSDVQVGREPVESRNPVRSNKGAAASRPRPRAKIAAVAALAFVAVSLGAASYLSPWSASEADAAPSLQSELLSDESPVEETEPVDALPDPTVGERSEPQVASSSDAAARAPDAGGSPAAVPSAVERTPSRAVVATPAPEQLRPLTEALVLGNVHLEGTRFDQAESVLAAALTSANRLLARYPQADTLRLLQRRLVTLRNENRVNCVALAEVVGGECPGGDQ